MFKKKEKLYSVYIPKESQLYYVPKPVQEYIWFLEKAVTDNEHELDKAKMELKIIKPVLESGTLKPAVSKSCYDCKYCVRSRWNGDILGCNKDLVCGDFTKVKGE